MGDRSLDGKIVVITGASSGIGEATAEQCAAAGATVVVAARRADRLSQLVARIEESGGTALAVDCDVTQRDAVEHLIRTAHDTYGRIDILVNNAGIMPLASMVECRVDDWDAMIDVNIKGLLYGIGSVLPIMREQKEGHIINVSSVAGRRLFPGAAVYCGTKHAVHAISEGLRGELSEAAREDGNRIRVTVLAPGVVTTELADSITHEPTRSQAKKYYGAMDGPLTSADMADAILYAATLPQHVEINEILVRPTRQIG